MSNKLKFVFAIYHIVVTITAYQCVSLYFPECIIALPINIINYYNVVASGMSLFLCLISIFSFAKQVPEKPTLEQYKNALAYKPAVFQYLYKFSAYAGYGVIIFTSIGQGYIYCLLVTTSILIWSRLLGYSLKLERQITITNFEANASKIN